MFGFREAVCWDFLEMYSRICPGLTGNKMVMERRALCIRVFVLKDLAGPMGLDRNVPFATDVLLLPP